MIQRVYEQASLVKKLEQVWVATDDQRIVVAVEAFGGRVKLTDKNHQSGTDRCLELANSLDTNFDVVVNIQGDEPYIQPKQIEQLINCFEDSTTEIATLVKQIETEEELLDPNRPKVLFDKRMNAIYFSRQTIPYNRKLPNHLDGQTSYYKHIGMYAYTMKALQSICELPQGKLELLEGLEQLRWIENDWKIKVAITNLEAQSIDTPEDLENLLKAST